MSYIISKLINLAGNITGILPVLNGGTGVTTSTGTGNTVLSNSPTLVTPALGTPASGNLSSCTNYPTVIPGTTAGLVSASGVPGNSTGSSISTGFVGNYISNIRSSATPNFTSGTICSIDSGNVSFNDGNEVGITLAAGIWDIQGTGAFLGAASTTATILLLFIGTAKGTGNTGQLTYANTTQLNIAFSAPATGTIQTPVWRVTNASPVTYYLKALATFSLSTLNATGTLRATLIA